MSGPDAAMDRLIAEFRTLGDADRRAILARLSFDERLRFDARMRPETEVYSTQIAAIVAGDGAGLTATAQAALRAAMAQGPAVASPAYQPSLFDRLWRRPR
jgi:hypothetical protein